MGKRIANKVLLIGWDAADWKVINPLMDKGLMPALEKLVNQGTMGKIATLEPPYSPMLWTSIATGKRPYKHGIHGFIEPTPDGQGVRPVFSTSRTCKAFWNILSQHGLRSHIVGWWPSHPAEPINGTMISNFYQKATGAAHEPWPMAEGVVHPKEKTELFARMRVHPGELTHAHLLPFVPKFAEADLKEDKHIPNLLNILAHATSLHSATTYILEHETWDVTAVYLDAIDHFCHAFMKYYPPRREHIDAQKYELYKGVVDAAYRFHDMMLERLLELAGEDTTVILVSDHGFHPDNNRPIKLVKEPAAPAQEHSPYGVFVMKGPGVKQDHMVYGTSVLDVCPTLLHLFGLPVAHDMDGKVVVNAFEEPANIETIPSWEDIPGDDGRHPDDMKVDTAAAKEELDQLVELGYIEKPKEEEGSITAESALKENQYNLARSYMDARLHDEAVPLLEALVEKYPDDFRYRLQLAFSYRALHRTQDSRRLLESVKQKHGKENAQTLLIDAMLLLDENRPKKALERLQSCEKMVNGRPKLYARIGLSYLTLGRPKDAERVFKEELLLNPENARACHGLGISYIRQGRFAEAIEVLLDAISLQYHFPFAHYHLGQALYETGHHEQALQAFQVAVKQEPNMGKARRWVEKLSAAGTTNKDMPEADNKKELVIVSGLPRSGTSMMMQMLKAGGMSLFTDELREADASNPKGYFEHEAVKKMARNQRFIHEVGDRAVKVIAQLLTYLPANYRYKIIFMERDLNEVISSQQKMLAREGKVKQDTVPLKLITAFEQTLNKVKQWAEENDDVEITYISHKQAIQQPIAVAQQVKAFLGKSLNETAMAKAVNKELYREHTTH